MKQEAYQVRGKAYRGAKGQRSSSASWQGLCTGGTLAPWQVLTHRTS